MHATAAERRLALYANSGRQNHLCLDSILFRRVSTRPQDLQDSVRFNHGDITSSSHKVCITVPQVPCFPCHVGLPEMHAVLILPPTPRMCYILDEAPPSTRVKLDMMMHASVLRCTQIPPQSMGESESRSCQEICSISNVHVLL